MDEMVGEHNVHQFVVDGIGHDPGAISHDVDPAGDHAVTREFQRCRPTGLGGRAAHGLLERVGRGVHMNLTANQPGLGMRFTEKLGEGLTSDRLCMLADEVGTRLARTDDDDVSRGRGAGCGFSGG